MRIMKKRWMAILLTVVMVMYMLPVSTFAENDENSKQLLQNTLVTEENQGDVIGDLGDDALEGTTIDGLKYAYKDGRAVITGYVGENPSIVIPATIGDNTVVGIGYKAFQYNSTIRSVEIQAALTEIGEYSFSYAYNLANITLPEGLVKIGQYAFKSCTSLTTVSFPTSLKEFDWGAFYGCTKLKMDLNCSNMKFGTESFRQTSITSISLTNCEIGSHAFMEIDTLERVSLDSCIWSSSVFSSDRALASAQLTNMDAIYAYCFQGCELLSQISLPQGTRSIEEYAFHSCSLLAGIYIPSTVTKIADNAFENDFLLTIYGEPGSYAQKFANEHGIEFKAGAMGEIDSGILTSDGFKIFYANDKAVIMGYVGTETDITIPETISGKKIFAIGYEAFMYSPVQRVKINGNIRKIAGSAFSYSSVSSVILPDGLEKLGIEAFRSCANLREINFPDSLEEIDRHAFYECASLKLNLSLKNVKIDSYSFYKTNLTSIDLENCVISSFLFSDIDSLKSVYLKDCTWYDARYAFEYDTMLSDVQLICTDSLPEDEDFIPYAMFRNCTSLTKFIIPDSVAQIWEEAFKDCVSLTAVYIPASVNRIADNAFENCPLLTIYGKANSYAETFAKKHDIPFHAGAIGDIVSGTKTIDGFEISYDNDRAIITKYVGNATEVTIPATLDGKSVIAIGSEAFKNSRIKSINIEAPVKTIAPHTFEGSTVETVVLPECLNKIDDFAFYCCSNLTEINLPDSLQIGIYAFQYCQKLGMDLKCTDVYFGHHSFADTSLTSVDLKNCTLDGDVFSDIRELKSVRLDSCIGGGFSGDEALTTVELINIEDISYHMFSECNSISKVVIPEGVKSIGEGAFKNCTLLSGIYIPSTVKSIANDAFDGDYLLFISTDVVGNEYSYVANWAEQAGIPCITIKYANRNAKNNGEWTSQFETNDLVNKTGGKGLYILSKDGQIWFNPNAVANITREGHNNGAHVGWGIVDSPTETGNTDFDNTIATALQNGAKIFNFNLSSDEKDLSEFNLDEKTGKINFGDNNGSAEITTTIAAGLKNVTVYYIDENGQKIKIQSKYDAKTGVVSFGTDHFSVYMVEPDDSVVPPTHTNLFKTAFEAFSKILKGTVDNAREMISGFVSIIKSMALAISHLFFRI